MAIADREDRRDPQVGVGGRQDVSEEQALDSRGRVGGEGQQRAEAEEPGDHHGDRRVAPDARDPAHEGDRHGRDRDARDSADQDRDPGQGGDHQAREEGVGEGLRRVGDAVEDHPAAQRPAGQRDQPDLEQRPADELLAQRICDEVDHQWWWAGRIPTWSLPGISTIAPA